MGRLYRLSKKITKTESDEILKEMKENEKVVRIEFTQDGTCLLIEASEENYPDILGKAVNICSRVANGLEISFAGFDVNGKDLNKVV
jgi:hypothetical protein